MRLSLRTLLLMMLLAGPLSAHGWSRYLHYLKQQEQARPAALRRVPPMRVLKPGSPGVPGAFPPCCGNPPPLATEMGMISLELEEFQKSLVAGK
jgi:hypothetical protein